MADDFQPSDSDTTPTRLHAFMNGLKQGHAVKAQRLKSFAASLPGVQGRHPFDLRAGAPYRSGLRLLKLALRARQLQPSQGKLPGLPSSFHTKQPQLRLPLPQGVRPVVTS